MLYNEAFQKLGYQLVSPRSDWTAESETGICITLWKEELAFNNGKPWIDTKLHCQPIEIWGDKPGNKKRIQHLQKAVSEYNGFVDVIIVHGEPGEKVTNADPWKQEGKRQGYRWKITGFEQDTGHFSATIEEA